MQTSSIQSYSSLWIKQLERGWSLFLALTTALDSIWRLNLTPRAAAVLEWKQLLKNHKLGNYSKASTIIANRGYESSRMATQTKNSFLFWLNLALAFILLWMTQEFDISKSNQHTFLDKKENQQVIEEFNHISYIINESDSKHSVNAGCKIDLRLSKSKLNFYCIYLIQMLIGIL